MEKTDEGLELEPQPDQSGEELEENLEESPVEGEKLPDSTDPLDKIEDIDSLRSEAKKFRAIASRKKEKKEPEKEPQKEEKGDFLKKSDFELVNQKKAVKMATIASDTDSEEIKTKKADILENFDEIKQYYTPRRGKTTPEDVLEDIEDAYAVFNLRRPKKTENIEGDIKTLTETKVSTGTATAPIQQKSTIKEPPGFNLPKQPQDWYPKKQ